MPQTDADNPTSNANINSDIQVESVILDCCMLAIFRIKGSSTDLDEGALIRCAPRAGAVQILVPISSGSERGGESVSSSRVRGRAWFGYIGCFRRQSKPALGMG